MFKQLTSVGLDVGTTTTQLIVSRLTVENRASSFAVPQMEITGRQILYKSPVHFTPLLGENLVDGAAIAKIVEQEYKNAGITRNEVDTGAVIITGETSRKENARAVLKELSGFAGDFVVATAGPDLESVLASKGSGAAAWSEDTGNTVLHMDIGGGTCNMALIEKGSIVATGCLNVGGRLIKLHRGKVIYVSPAIKGLTDLTVGEYPNPGQLEGLAKILTLALEMAAGLRPPTELLDNLTTAGTGKRWLPPETVPVLSFSGGVAACMEKDLEFDDLGGILGKAIRQSKLCGGPYRIGNEPIRATVIGAGSHSAQLSGSTVYHDRVTLPVKNLPVVAVRDLERIAQAVAGQDSDQVVLALEGLEAPGYEAIKAMAEAIVRGLGDRPVYVALKTDMAKALGHCLRLLCPERPILCIDRVALAEGSFLDVGSPLGSCLPVVVKTIIFER